MNPDLALQLAQEAVRVALFIAAPVVGISLMTGLFVSIFQATTQINEASLQFVPKILAALTGMVVFGPWMLTTIVDFAHRMIALIPAMAR